MSPNTLSKLSRRERQIMDILYEGKQLSAQEVLQAMEDAPSYSTVRALLARLVEKGHVRFSQNGAKYIYFPVLEKSSVQKSAMSRLLKTFFSGSRVKAVNALLELEKEPLSSQEIQELERSLDRLKKNASTSD